MIQLQNITKIYRRGDTTTAALQNISCEVRRGETVALCGPSGSGKSTLLNICGLIDNRYEGELFLDGIKVSKDPLLLTKIRRDQIGFIFQSYNLVEVMTAFENVEYPLILSDIPKGERKHMVLSILHSVGLQGHEYKRPEQMSGGQQQRVAIARALVKKPKLVIADEPTANLDTETATLVMDLMRDLGHQVQTTFLVATHDDRMTSRCDRTLRMQDGVLAEVQQRMPRSVHNSSVEGEQNAEYKVSLV